MSAGQGTPARSWLRYLVEALQRGGRQYPAGGDLQGDLHAPAHPSAGIVFPPDSGFGIKIRAAKPSSDSTFLARS